MSLLGFFRTWMTSSEAQCLREVKDPSYPSQGGKTKKVPRQQMPGHFFVRSVGPRSSYNFFIPKTSKRSKQAKISWQDSCPRCRVCVSGHVNKFTDSASHPHHSSLRDNAMMHWRRSLEEFKPKSVIRLLCTNKLSFCHLFHRFSVTMEPHCSFKASKNLLKNINCHHHNANDRFGLKRSGPWRHCFVMTGLRYNGITMSRQLTE